MIERIPLKEEPREDRLLNGIAWNLIAEKINEIIDFLDSFNEKEGEGLICSCAQEMKEDENGNYFYPTCPFHDVFKECTCQKGYCEKHHSAPSEIEIVPSPRIDYCCDCKKEHGYDCPQEKIDVRALMAEYKKLVERETNSALDDLQYRRMHQIIKTLSDALNK